MDHIINNNGYCKYCTNQTIHYGIEGGSYTYRCTTCKRDLNGYEVLNKKPLLTYGNTLENGNRVCRVCNKARDPGLFDSSRVCTICRLP